MKTFKALFVFLCAAAATQANGAVMTTEALARFTVFDNAPGAAQVSSTSTVATVNQSLSFSGTNGGILDAAARADVNGLGIRLRGDSGLSGEVSASFFEGVFFVTPQLASGSTPPARLSNVSFGLVGRASGSLSHADIFGATAPGAAILGATRVGLRYFETTQQRDTNIGSTGILAVTRAGPFSVTYDLSSALMLPTATAATFGQASTGGPCALTPEACDLIDVSTPGYFFTDFGLGLAFDGAIGGELFVEGAVEAFNSFVIDGLVAFDADGNVLNGQFITRSGEHLTLSAPVPAPPAFLMLLSALAGFSRGRRRPRNITGTVSV